MWQVMEEHHESPFFEYHAYLLYRYYTHLTLWATKTILHVKHLYDAMTSTLSRHHIVRCAVDMGLKKNH